MKNLFKSTFLIFSILGVFSSFLMVAQAENIVDVNFPCPGSDIPGFPECERQPDGVVDNDFVGYVIRIYQFGIGIVGIVAVGMIVYGGILIAWNTESVDKKGKGREMITSALIGIAVLFGSYLILNTINPQLVRFDLAGTVPDKSKDADTLGGETDKGLSRLQTLCGENGNPASILRPNGEAPGMPNCEYRKTTYKGGSFDVGKDETYYGEWFADGIEEGDVIWSYPYFISVGEKKGTSTAMCLIYAYKKGSSSIEKIDLDDDLALCSLNPEIKQKTSDEGVGGQSAASELIEGELRKYGVTISSTGNCNFQDDPSCTSLEGLPQKSIDFLKKLGSGCRQTSGWQTMENCTVVITGGTEVGHATHGMGKNVFDIRSSGPGVEKLAAILKNSSEVKKVCTTPDQWQYKKDCASFDETVGHFHIEL